LNLSAKLRSIAFPYVEPDGTTYVIGVFSMFATGGKYGDNLYVKVDNFFHDWFNGLLTSGNYTRFHLKNIVKLDSGYTKELFRRCMQFTSSGDKSGWWLVTMDDFRKQLGIPKSYQMGNIDQKILNVAKEEFESKGIFEYFHWTKEKSGQGNKVTHIKFHFKLVKQTQTPSQTPIEGEYHDWMDEIIKTDDKSGLDLFKDTSDLQHFSR
jgi:Initiator Rep protein, WH2/Initiator Replication protein, WH1